MVGVIFPLAVVLLLSFSASVLLGRRAGMAIPFVMMGCVVAVYVCCVAFRSFSIGCILLVVVAVASAAFSALKLARGGEGLLDSAKRYCLTPGVVAFAFFAVAAAVVAYHHGARVIFWDEYAHWGQMVKEIIRLDYFYVGSETTLEYHNDYPPMPPLLEALFCRLSGEYDERIVCFSLWLLQLSAFLPAIEAFGRRRGFAVGLVPACAVLLLTLLVPCFDGGAAAFWKSFYPDVLLAMVFGLGMWLALRYRAGVLDTAALAVLLAFLILAKQSALFFAGMVLVAAFLRGALLVRDGVVSKRAFVASVCTLCFACLVAYASWKLVLAWADVSGWRFSLGLGDVISIPGLFAGVSGEDYQQDSVWAFLWAFFFRPITSFLPVNPSYAFASAVLVAVPLGMALRAEAPALRKSLLLAAVVFGISAIMYAVLMMALYAFSFNSVDAITLASYERYMGTGVAGLSAALFMMLLDGDGKKGRNVLVGVCIAACLIVAVSPSVFNQFRMSLSTPSLDFAGMESSTAFVEEHVPEGDSVLIVNEGCNIAEVLLACYYSNGVEISRLPETIWKNDDPYWTVDADQMRDMFLEEDYVFFRRVSDGFEARYASALSGDVSEGCLYKVDGLEGSKLVLVPVACESEG